MPENFRWVLLLLNKIVKPFPVHLPERTMFIYLTLILITLPFPSVGQNVYAGICKHESLYTHTNATCTGNPTCTNNVLTYMHTNATCTSQQGCVYHSGVYFNGLPYASCDDLGKYAFLITLSLYFFYNYNSALIT